MCVLYFLLDLMEKALATEMHNVYNDKCYLCYMNATCTISSFLDHDDITMNNVDFAIINKKIAKVKHMKKIFIVLNLNDRGSKWVYPGSNLFIRTKALHFAVPVKGHHKNLGCANDLSRTYYVAVNFDQCPCEFIAVEIPALENIKLNADGIITNGYTVIQ